MKVNTIVTNEISNQSFYFWLGNSAEDLEELTEKDFFDKVNALEEKNREALSKWYENHDKE